MMVQSKSIFYLFLISTWFTLGHGSNFLPHNDHVNRAVEICDGLLVELDLATDFNPADTSWTITDLNSKEIVGEGGDYGASGETFYPAIALCLNELHCYNFTIIDSFGDGIQNGEGISYAGYELKVNGGAISTSFNDVNGNFGYNETIIFGGNIEGDGCLPEELVDHHEVCGSDEIDAQVDLFTDSYPVETTWIITNHFTGEEIINLKDYQDMSPKYLYQHRLCLPADTCMEFQIRDYYGDGLDETADLAGYNFTVNDVLLATSYDNEEGDFGRMESVEFGACTVDCESIGTHEMECKEHNEVCKWDKEASSCKYRNCFKLNTGDVCDRSDLCSWDPSALKCFIKIEKCTETTDEDACKEHNEVCKWDKEGSSCNYRNCFKLNTRNVCDRSDLCKWDPSALKCFTKNKKCMEATDEDACKQLFCSFWKITDGDQCRAKNAGAPPITGPVDCEVIDNKKLCIDRSVCSFDNGGLGCQYRNCHKFVTEVDCDQSDLCNWVPSSSGCFTKQEKCDEKTTEVECKSIRCKWKPTHSFCKARQIP